jgi:predicted N-acetyltransferase YhbS
MAGNLVEVKRLGELSELSGTIASLQFSCWGALTGFNSAEQYERFLRDTAASQGLPAVLVATRGGALAGSVNLIEREMTTRPLLSPWMAQLFVIETERGRGVGNILVKASISHVVALGFRRLHLYTSGTLTGYYSALGWKPIEQVEYLGKPRTIMAFDAR